MYARPFYTVVSFVLFLIALTFPITPNKQQIAQYNRWLFLLFELLPMDPAICKRTFLALHTKQIKTRSEFLDLVFALHASILKTELNRTEILLFFDQLRASECDTQTSNEKKETGCRHKTRTTENVSYIFFHADADSTCFLLDDNLRVEKDRKTDIHTDSLNNPNAFCSCLFSAKWFLLHMIASGFPAKPTNDQRQTYQEWLFLFGDLLACFACRVNFRNNMRGIEFDTTNDLANTYTFEMLLYRLHAAVNDMLGQNNISFATMKRTFIDLERCVHNDHFATIAITNRNDDNRLINVLE